MDGSRIPMFSPTKSVSTGLPRPQAASSAIKPPSRPKAITTDVPSLSSANHATIAQPLKRTSIPSPQKSKFSTAPSKTPASKKLPGIAPPPRSSVRPAASPIKSAVRKVLPIEQTSIAKPRTTLSAKQQQSQSTGIDPLQSSSRLVGNRPTLTASRNVATPKPPSKARASLSDRTVESLSRLPSTPASARRTSSFFNPDSPMVSPTAPRSKASVVARPAPGMATARLTVTKMQRPQVRSPIPATPNSIYTRRSMSITHPKGLTSLKTTRGSIPARPSSAMSNNSGRLTSSRTSSRAITPDSMKIAEVAEPPCERPVSRQSIASNPEVVHRRFKNFAEASAALQETIAEARARAQLSQPAATTSPVERQVAVSTAAPSTSRVNIEERVHTARVYGHLDLSGMELSHITDDIRTMYDKGPVKDSPMLASNCVELSGLTLNNNDIEELGDTDFPDEDQGPISARARLPLAGLERLSMSANRLQCLPVGLRRLMHLTTFNLSFNCLGNGPVDIVGQIISLKHLNLSHNKLSGHLPAAVSRLVNLKSLDLSGNKLLSLPDSLSEIKGLRVLDVSCNQLTSIPAEVVQMPSLTEINAASNSLVGAFFSFGVSALSGLKSLDISNNALASLAFSENVSLPALQSINIAGNHMISLPDVSSWTSLKILNADSNQISELPAGFATLKQLRHLDLSNNSLREIDPCVAEMTQLDVLRVAGNPLVRRDFIDLSAKAIKHALASQSPSPSPTPADRHCSHGSFEDEAIDVRSQASTDHVSPWKVSTSGLVDLESKGLVDSDADSLRAFLGINNARELSLAKNKFTQIPSEIALAQGMKILDMSDCRLGASYLTEPLHLPCLQKLRLGGNDIQTLQPLLTFLRAPGLETIEMTGNGAQEMQLEVLREVFPHIANVQY